MTQLRPDSSPGGHLSTAFEKKKLTKKTKLNAKSMYLTHFIPPSIVAILLRGPLHSDWIRSHLCLRYVVAALLLNTHVEAVSSRPLFIQSGGKLSRTLGKKPPVLLKTHPNDPNGKGKRRKQKWSHLKTTARIPWVEWGLPPRGASSWYCCW